MQGASIVVSEDLGVNIKKMKYNESEKRKDL